VLHLHLNLILARYQVKKKMRGSKEEDTG